MEGSIIFYTYGSTLELYGQQFTAGMLTADLLNLSPDEYRPMSKRMKQITGLAEEYEQSGSIELWWKLNEELAALCGVLRRYAVFRLLLDESEDAFFSVIREVTGSSICFRKRSMSRQKRYNGNDLSAWRMKSPRAVKRSRMFRLTCSIRAKQL